MTEEELIQSMCLAFDDILFESNDFSENMRAALAFAKPIIRDEALEEAAKLIEARKALPLFSAENENILRFALAIRQLKSTNQLAIPEGE